MFKSILMVLVVLVFMGAGGVWTYFQWQECKEMGHSTFYCLGHISR